MTTNDKLFQETLLRVGPDEMVGVRRLAEGGHTGIAERHTVEKLFKYVRGLEEKLGIHIPSPQDRVNTDSNMVKINEAGVTYFASKPA